MSNNIVNKQVELTPIQRKLRKFKRSPKLFLADSKAYVGAQKTVYLTWAKLGSFALVILASLLVVIYYSLLASPRYVSQAQFVVKQAVSNDLPIAGLAAIGGSTPSMRDALILQQYIQSTEMAMALNNSLQLKTHYQDARWDMLSRLGSEATQEDFVEYYQAHIKVTYDELSEMLHIELQSYDTDYSLQLTQSLLNISEVFINNLGETMAQAQLQYAEGQVQRAYSELKLQQLKLVAFQDENTLFNPELQSAALFEAVNKLEAAIIEQNTELKSLQAFMRSDSAEVKAKQYRIDALEEQLAEEKLRLTSQDSQSLNKVNLDFKELELNALLAADLYKSSLTSLELMRSEAFKNLKHLLIIEHPRLAEQQSYPRRIYSIFTWFVVLILVYLVGRLIVSVVKEHKE